MKRLNIYLSDEQNSIIRAYAAARGMNISQAIRQLVPTMAPETTRPWIGDGQHTVQVTVDRAIQRILSSVR